MASFFEKLRKQVGFHRDDEETNDLNHLSRPDGAVSEDDGYLLVGQTVSERTTVRAQDFPQNNDPSAPPTYCQVSNKLPSYDNVVNGDCVILSGPSMFNNVSLTPCQGSQSVPQRHQSPISDVPFELNPVLRIRQGINSIFDGINLMPQRFDWGKYSHNFNHEHLCLRELNSDSAADITDFSFSTMPVSSDAFRDSSNNEDLMTF